MGKNNRIPIIDLFAGPGGLGEGFSSLGQHNGGVFDLRLSIEKDTHAHQTLLLRKFFRAFPCGAAPDEYYDYVGGQISKSELFEAYPEEGKQAEEAAWLAELGSDKFPDKLIDKRIIQALGGAREWVLLGGPPCQAYSLVGRSRMINTHPDFFGDHRHLLYRQYLRIIRQHSPSIFVMENVKGLLSSKLNDQFIFEKIRQDLSSPWGNRSPDGYKLYSLSTPAVDPWQLKPADYIIRAEDYGVPQMRHRVILLGIRNDYLSQCPGTLSGAEKRVTVRQVIADLPRLRSRLSRTEDSYLLWKQKQKELLAFLKGDVEYKDLISAVSVAVNEKVPDYSGASHVKYKKRPAMLAEWLADPRLIWALNHEARSHMGSDLWRYLFCSIFAQKYGVSPKLSDFPEAILPAHRNASSKKVIGDFADRFRVQTYNRPATTIVSHISKDGHYFIHPDPEQCRSLTVREAARIQTFPDNYFFEGNRTQQYTQVGNAVPPYLAYQIAEVVYSAILAHRQQESKKRKAVS